MIQLYRGGTKKEDDGTEYRERGNLMKKFLTMIAAVMFIFLAIIPAACAETGEQRMYVSTPNGGTVRLRSIPSTEGKILTVVGVGRPVTVVKQYESGWSEVKIRVKGATKYGYMKSEYLSIKDPSTRKQSFRDAKEPFTVKPFTASANGKVSLWDTTAKKDVDKIRDLGSDESVTVIAYSNAWYKVCTNDGLVGYVAKAYVTK